MREAEREGDRKTQSERERDERERMTQSERERDGKPLRSGRWPIILRPQTKISRPLTRSTFPHHFCSENKTREDRKTKTKRKRKRKARQGGKNGKIKL